MTSLIFGAVYLGHQAVVGHRHEKQRVKNYQRWEGLRDEYDEQKRTQRETRSLDIQRTGMPFDNHGEERPIMTLRDQQEADDARTSWRPQESFTPMHTGAQQQQQQQQTGMQPGYGRRPQSMDVDGLRSVSDQRGYSTQQRNGNGYGVQPQPTGYQQQQPTGMTMRPLPAQQTGAWDDGLPQRLKVSRLNFDDGGSTGQRSPGIGVQRASSLRELGSRGSPLVQQQQQQLSTPPSMTPRSPYAGSTESLNVPKRNASSRSPSIPEERMVEHEMPGGRMAELIEGSGATGGRPHSHHMATAPAGLGALPSGPMAHNPNAQVPVARAGESDMHEWWSKTGTTPGVEKDMQEWWKQ